MSLNYYLNDIENWQELRASDGGLLPQTQSLVFSTITVGLGEITEKNLDEFYARLNIAERLYKIEETPYAMVQRHIGLKTNVRDETWLQWIKRWMNYEKQEVIYRAKQAEKN